MVALVVIFGFVFLFVVGCVRQSRAVREQRQLGQLAELLLIRRALEISTSVRNEARSESTNSAEDQQPQA